MVPSEADNVTYTLTATAIIAANVCCFYFSLTTKTGRMNCTQREMLCANISSDQHPANLHFHCTHSRHLESRTHIYLDVMEYGRFLDSITILLWLVLDASSKAGNYQAENRSSAEQSCTAISHSKVGSRHQTISHNGMLGCCKLRSIHLPLCLHYMEPCDIEQWHGCCCWSEMTWR